MRELVAQNYRSVLWGTLAIAAFYLWQLAPLLGMPNPNRLEVFQGVVTEKTWLERYNGWDVVVSSSADRRQFFLGDDPCQTRGTRLALGRKTEVTLYRAIPLITDFRVWRLAQGAEIVSEKDSARAQFTGSALWKRLALIFAGSFVLC